MTLAFGGCAFAPDVPKADLSVERSAAALEARTLVDPALHRFLVDNLGRDPGQTWDFESLCWVAFYYHPSLQLARAQWATARAAERTAHARPNPTLTLTPGYDFTHQPGVSPWMPSIGLDFLLPTNGKRARQQDMAAADADAARLAVYATVWQARSDLRKALADTTTAGRRAELLRRQSDVQHELLALLEQRFTAGSIAAADVSVTRTAWFRAEAAAADAANQAEVARAHLASALGVPAAALNGVELPEVPMAPAMNDEALTTAKRLALISRADVLGALAKYRSADAALALESAKSVPDIHLGPGYQWDQGLSKWTLGLTVELPIFNRNEGPIAEAVARRAEAAAQFNLVQSQALAAIETALAAQRAAEAQLRRAHALRDEVERQAAFVRQRQAAGAADRVELGSAQLDVATADATLLDAEAAAATASGQLEDALQVPFPHLAALADATRPALLIAHE